MGNVVIAYLVFLLHISAGQWLSVEIHLDLQEGEYAN